MAKQEPLLPDGLSIKERRFCHAYLMNGLDMNRTSKSLGIKDRSTFYKYLALDHVKKYLSERVSEMEEKFQVSFEQKLCYLWRIAEICMPFDASTHEGYKPEVSIRAVNELNKMQGHHAPEEYLHRHKKDSDIEGGNALLASLIDEHKKDY